METSSILIFCDLSRLQIRNDANEDQDPYTEDTLVGIQTNGDGTKSCPEGKTKAWTSVGHSSARMREYSTVQLCPWFLRKLESTAVPSTGTFLKRIGSSMKKVFSNGGTHWGGAAPIDSVSLLESTILHELGGKSSSLIHLPPTYSSVSISLHLSPRFFYFFLPSLLCWGSELLRPL